MKTIRKLIASAAFSVLAVSANATTLNGFLTADDAFQAYISTNENILGTLIGAGASWPTTFPLTPTMLTPGMTHYLHIIADDGGSPEMFVGDFTLSDANFVFANGTQSLLTNAVHWRASPTSGPPANPLNWTVPTGTPVSFGLSSSTGPWGPRPSISGSAEFIWTATPSGPGPDSVFFATTITPITAAIPEPSTWLMLLVGLGVLALGSRLRTAA